MRFRVGDRVRAIQNIYGFEINSLTGTIAVISEGSIGVAFDSYVSGAHSLNGRCENGCGLWVGKNDLELIGRSAPEPTLKKCNERETLTFATPEQIVETVNKTEIGSTFAINGLRVVVVERNNGLAWCISEPIRWENELFDSFLAQYHSIMVDYDWSMEDFGDDKEYLSRKGKAFPISLNDWRKHWDKMGGFKIVNSIHNPIRLSTGLKNTPFVVRDIHSRRVDAGLFSSNLNVWNDTTCVKFAIKEEI